MEMVGQANKVEEAGGVGGEEDDAPHPQPRHLPEFRRQPDIRLIAEGPAEAGRRREAFCSFELCGCDEREELVLKS
jgi:hypothetical protein